MKCMCCYSPDVMTVLNITVKQGAASIQGRLGLCAACAQSFSEWQRTREEECRKANKQKQETTK